MTAVVQAPVAMVEAVAALCLPHEFLQILIRQAEERFGLFPP